MPSKLRIIAYTDQELRSKTGEYTLHINPKTLSQTHTSEFATNIATDTVGTVLKFHTQAPQDLSFDFVIDTTGVGSSTKNVSDEIDRFRDIAYTYHGKIHSPNYLKVVWDGTTFQCMLTKLTIAFQLFSPTGKPLRAKLSVAFCQHQTPKELARRADKKSADLTHTEVVTSKLL